MITFDSGQNKILIFDITVDGIMKNLLTFWIRIKVNKMEYGFEGKLGDDGKVTVWIPPLVDILKDSFSTEKTYPIYLDVCSDKYFKRPWIDEMTIKSMPKVSADIIINEKEKLQPSISLKLI